MLITVELLSLLFHLLIIKLDFFKYAYYNLIIPQNSEAGTLGLIFLFNYVMMNPRNAKRVIKAGSVWFLRFCRTLQFAGKTPQFGFGGDQK